MTEMDRLLARDAKLLYCLGIDTGGTYTDAALVAYGRNNIVATGKALTTRQNLAIGIRQAVAGVFGFQENEEYKENVGMVALSTTLATNAIIEGHGGHVCLLLIGYDQHMMHRYAFEKEIETDDIVYVPGGHDLQGNETESLDEDVVRKTILERKSGTDAFAISGYFGTRNTEHERRVRKIVEDLTDIPVTCGNELTSRLNAIRRAATVVLNARLIPLLRDLIDNVQNTLEKIGLTSPLMIVKGDGSLVSAEWAIKRPVETILSGPAASAIGASFLSGKRNMWIVDMGGTSTDIALLKDGRPKMNTEGARIGGRRTMVEAVDVHTVGLGGDSHVRIDREKRLLIGPRRAVPLCLLAMDYPNICETLKRQRVSHLEEERVAQFLVSGRNPVNRLSSKDKRLIVRIKKEPVALLGNEIREDASGIIRIRHLEKMSIVQRSGFTPTDALHALGKMQCWDRNASTLAAELLASRLGISVAEFCERVVSEVSTRVGKEIVSKILESEAGLPSWDDEPAANTILKWGFSDEHDGELACRLKLKLPVVAVGAAAQGYVPRTAEMLHTESIIPNQAGVANAVGAVAGNVIQRANVRISPLNGGTAFRLHLPKGVCDFADLEKAVSYARSVMRSYMESLARKAGAEDVEVRMVRRDHRETPKLGWAQVIYLDTELVFTAVGRPGISEAWDVPGMH
ncbi:MAG: hydantoinase/oxoprolinase family protein [Deltaproteobacteria bacterium]|nr:hydantoinase/oxoprolinase family protein [Deltaproteobacteria bacterium]